MTPPERLPLPYSSSLSSSGSYLRIVDSDGLKMSARSIRLLRLTVYKLAGPVVSASLVWDWQMVH